MRILINLGISLLFVSSVYSQLLQTDLPKVFSANSLDKTGSSLREKAEAASAAINLQYPFNNITKSNLSIQEFIFRHAGITLNKETPLELKATKVTEYEDFRIENIRFQTQPGIYATASLYIPNGKGPFPAVLNMHGHWPDGRRTEITQTTAQLLAMNGYVCLNIDAWGSGERGTHEHQHEYHGSGLGASLLNVGNTLLGQQLTDNIRAVDLLCSLPYVDKENIGATGASGGGNQTMWVGAADKRIKAIVPVVSIGTFESYIMNSNCFCELLPSGLMSVEEWVVLGSMSPRALKILTAMNDANPSFSYIQMLRTFEKAQEVYNKTGVTDNIEYELFNTGHGYWPEMQLSMLSWFNKYLKKDETREVKGLDKVQLISIDKLATYPPGKREKEVITTGDYCRIKGANLRKQMLNLTTIQSQIKQSELKEITSVNYVSVKKIHQLAPEKGWERNIIETAEGELIPLLIKHPADKTNNYTIYLHPLGKDSLATQTINKYASGKEGIVLVDLWGTGERESSQAKRIDGSLPPFHTLSRSLLWLGQTITGKWIEDIQSVEQVLKVQYHAESITLYGFRETAVAALLHSALNKGSDQLILEDAPVSYLFDNEQQVNFYNMAIYIPGFLVWGDISLAASLSDSGLTFINARSISGKVLTKKERENYTNEFIQMRKKTGKNNNVEFIYNNKL